MKRCFVILLCAVLLFSTLPVSANNTDIEAAGAFQGRLLASGYDVVYDYSLENHLNAEQAVLLVLAQYAGEKLEKAEPYTITLPANGSLSETKTITGISADVTEVKAFIFNNSSALQPLLRADRLHLGYESIYNDFAHSNLQTDFGTIPGNETEFNERFPVSESFQTRWDKAWVNGASMVAYFETAPTEIYISVDTRIEDQADQPVSFKQFRTARLLNPDGEVVCYYDFSENSAGHKTKDEIVFKVPAYSGSGLWTVSYVGGRGTYDLVTVGIPQTDYWGLRGEMQLGLVDKTMETEDGTYNRKWYLYVPEESVGTTAVILSSQHSWKDQLIVKKSDSTKLQWLVDTQEDGSQTVSDLSNFHANALYGRITEADAGTCWTVCLPTDRNGNTFYHPNYIHPYGLTYSNNQYSGYNSTGIFIAVSSGLPGLLCPTKEAAMFLKGGLVTSADGRNLGGTVQARARDASVDIAKNGELEVDVDLMKERPATISDDMLDIEALICGSYGGINAIQTAAGLQNLDYRDIYLGSIFTEFSDNEQSNLTYRASFENSVYNSNHTNYADCYANLAGTPTKLNAAYGNRALINRSVLSAFNTLVELSPEGLMRTEGLTKAVQTNEDGSLVTHITENGTTKPVSYAADYWPTEPIFMYSIMAVSYNLMKDKVTPDVQEIWKNGLIQIGDKLANYQANDTNQWTEMIYGHLEVYKATGEERFLEYFERNAVAITKPPVDSGSFGQSAAGYYLERRAPSATYGSLAMHNMLAAFYTYQALDNRDEEVYQAMKESVSKEITFEALNWLTVPKDGAVYSPTAQMVKGGYPFYGGGYPNVSLAAAQFPVAAELHKIRTAAMTRTDVGAAGTSPDFAFGKPDLALGLLEKFMFPSTTPVSYNFNGGWTPRCYEVFSQVERTNGIAAAPIYETDKKWDLEGVYAWKKNGLYVLNYYSNPYSVPSSVSLLAHRGGLPFAVWSEGTGPVVLANNLNDSTQSISANPTTYYSGLFAVDADGVTHTTKYSEGTMTEKSETGYTIVQKVGTDVHSSKEICAGNVTYEASFTETGYMIDVIFTPTEEYTLDDFSQLYVTLPICNPRTGSSSTTEGEILHTLITQSDDRKILNYKSTHEGAYGSVDIITSTEATLDDTYGYTQWAGTASQLLMIPLDDTGTLRIEFRVNPS